MTTWRELEAQGVKRCCATFTNGKRCRRRAVEAFEWLWCAKHGPTMQAHIKHAIEAMKSNGNDNELR
jgi:hypothetical protein